MTLAEYKKKYSRAPLGLDEHAELAWRVTDDIELMHLARKYLDAEAAFEEALEDRKIEV